MRTHTYQPPLEFALQRPMEEGSYSALKLLLPGPPNGDSEDEAFFYKRNGSILGYFNRCMHRPLPMDLADGKFLDTEGFVICRVHGARYELETGLPAFGPAISGLFRILCEEKGSTLRILGWEKAERESGDLLREYRTS